MRKMIILALAATAVAAPAVAMGHGGEQGHSGKVPVVSYEFVGTVMGSATADGFTVAPVRGINRHARRALDGADSLLVKLGPSTRIRVRVANAGGGWSFGPGTFTDLQAGDRVRIQIRAPKRTPAAALPAAAKVRDFTPYVPPAPPAPQPPSDPGTVPIPGTIIPPGATPPTLP